MKLNRHGVVALIVTIISSAGVVQAKDTPTKLVDARVADRTHYSPYINDTYPDNVYFGDTHLPP